ncbi:MAG: lipoate--protein ligase family protein [Candidatus Methanomethyliaceae archaeon]|nr:lipoate--protein ligase family protein [Candidatus Methanomethyliaceae archaeon]MDW7971228.1 biotin/lipoate A/B protein ligase family protein [Nitrososphaerota archaeon]
MRVLKFQVNDPFYNMALDEAVAKSVGKGISPPTLRLYGWWPRAVSIGYFQEVMDVVDMEFCKNQGIEIVRRITGGGAVIHTEGELTYSFIVKDDESIVSRDIEESYKQICSPIINALKKLGLNANFRPINDIEVEGRKISGNAQTRRFGAVLQHGTILISLNYNLLRALKIDVEKFKDKGVKDVSKRVTTLKELGIEISREQLSNALIIEFEKSFNMKPIFIDITEEEKRITIELLSKYKSSTWNFRR